jgi:hypothetical protein
MIIVETDENAYAFSRIRINLNPPPALLPGGLPLIPVLATISLIIMMLSIILRMRGRYMGFFYPLITIATFLLLVYISLWYFGLVPMF